MFVKLLDLIKNQKELMTLKNFCKFVPVTGLTLLSGYFAAIYVLMLILILAIYCRTAKQKQNEKFIGISLLLSILFARLLFCGFFYGFSCGRAGEAYKKFSFSAISENFCNSCVAYFNIIHDHLFNVCIFGILLVVVTVVLVRRIKTIFDEKILLIFLSCFLWSFTCIFLAPFKLLRYTMACFPLFTLIFPYVILQIKKRGIRCVAAASTIFLTSGFWDSSAKIDFLFTGQSKRAESFTSKSDARVFIFSKWCDCEPAPILHLLSDEQYYEFPKSKERLAARLKEPAFVLFTEEYSDKDIQDFIPEGFTFIYKDEYSLFSVYEAKSVSADYFFDKK
jgi:hypothetical protein